VGDPRHLVLQLEPVCLLVIEQKLCGINAVARRLDGIDESDALRLCFSQMLLHKADAVVENRELPLQRRELLLQGFYAGHPLARELNKMLCNTWSISSLETDNVVLGG
jgi:hypothetical protein